MKLAANLSWLYTELEFMDRLLACAQDGFRYAECMFPYEQPAALLREKAIAADVQWVLINAPAGNWAQGDRGLAVQVAHRDQFKKSIEQAAQYAEILGLHKVHVLAGIVDLKNSDAVARAWACYEQNLSWLADFMQGEQIDWLIEPINRTDMPGYLVSEQAAAHELICSLGKPNLGVQMDLYHCQVEQSNAIEAIARYIPSGRVKHLQIAGVPNRNEPYCGELDPNASPSNVGLDYSKVFAQLQALDYTGHIGCEYRPKASTRDGLGWIRNSGFSGTMEAFESKT